MRLVALDLGTQSACVVSDPGMPLVVSEWDCRVRRGESGGMRFLRFRRLLAEVLDNGPRKRGAERKTIVAYEHPGGNIRSAAAAAVLLGLASEVQAACAGRGYEYLPVNPSDVKREATGKGGGKGTDKAAIVAAAQARWSHLDVSSDHVADALWVMRCAQRELGWI